MWNKKNVLNILKQYYLTTIINNINEYLEILDINNEKFNFLLNKKR